MNERLVPPEEYPIRVEGPDKPARWETEPCSAICQPGYNSLFDVLIDALDQAAEGKGKERHVSGDEPFEQQPICEITRRTGLGFPTGQAVKKIYEALRMPPDRAVAELLGAINYIAAAVIVRRENAEQSS